MIVLFTLAISIPITAVLVFLTVYLYRQGYVFTCNIKGAYARAFMLTMYGLPFNIVFALYSTGVVLYFSHGLKSGMDITTIVIGLIISLFIGTIYVLWPLMWLDDPHDTQTILAMFHLSSAVLETIFAFLLISVLTWLAWSYKFKHVKR